MAGRESTVPILTETNHPRKRRAPVWLLILALVVLPLVGRFGWSSYRPIVLRGTGGTDWYFFLGNAGEGDKFLPTPRTVGPKFISLSFKLPGRRKTNWYAAYTVWE